MRIKIKSSQRKITIDKKKLINLAGRVLKIKGKQKAELSLLLVGKNRIRALNKKFRNIDRPTDVLAFSMCEGKSAHLHPELLGDLVICPEIAKRQAIIYKTSKDKELCLYLIHGILHLLGYDDKYARNRCLMEKEQRRILKKLR